MSKLFPTTKTNVRLSLKMIDAINQRTDNFNGFCRESLNWFVHCFTLQPEKYKDDLGYMAHYSMFHHVKTGWNGEKKLVTLRLTNLDVETCRLSNYDLSRTLIIALDYAIRSTSRTNS